MPTITIEESDVTLADILCQLKAGNEILLTQGKIAIARVVPVPQEPKLRKPELGTAAGQVWMFDDFDDPLPDFEEYR